MNFLTAAFWIGVGTAILAFLLVALRYILYAALAAAAGFGIVLTLVYFDEVERWFNHVTTSPAVYSAELQKRDDRIAELGILLRERDDRISELESAPTDTTAYETEIRARDERIGELESEIYRMSAVESRLRDRIARFDADAIERVNRLAMEEPIVPMEVEEEAAVAVETETFTVDGTQVTKVDWATILELEDRVTLKYELPICKPAEQPEPDKVVKTTSNRTGWTYRAPPAHEKKLDCPRTPPGVCIARGYR